MISNGEAHVLNKVLNYKVFFTFIVKDHGGKEMFNLMVICEERGPGSEGIIFGHEE